jgi:uncharacterized RDD family membrane protein YckC
MRIALSTSTSNLPALPPTAPDSGWKDEVSARIRAHRTGRGRVPENQPALPGMESAAPSTIAARVAERYARIPSWREAMAAEAAAQAAAAAATPPAPAAKPATPRRAKAPARAAAPDPVPTLDLNVATEAADSPTAPPQPYQPDLIRYSVCSDSLPTPRSTPAEARIHASAVQPSRAAILDPLEEAIVEPTRLLPARVIEFPRELVAPRKARPRIAEGPLSEAPGGENLSASSGTEELRILEAEPDNNPQRSQQSNQSRQSRPGPGEAAVGAHGGPPMPEWHSIRLDPEEPVRASTPTARISRLDNLHLHVAPIEDRLMSGVVDVALTLAAFLVFVLVFAACTTHPPSGKPALLGAGITLLAMWVLYQFIFFSLSAATPGMRYAKIALCTFSDDNPTRKAMRFRIAALLLSALPLGLGFLWAVFDEDALGWHDRITQTYQRSYRES